MSNDIHSLYEYARGIMQPDPQESVVAWCERCLRLTQAQTETPGPYTTSLTPYVKDILNDFGDSSVHDLVWVSGSQVGKTMTLMAGLAHQLVHDPCPMIWVMPTESLARSFAENRWIPMLRDSKETRDILPADVKKMKILEQQFIRCTMNLVGSNSPANLASRPARLLVMDEVDKFAVATTRESNALELAEQRTKTYSMAKRVKTSTPTVDEGLIWREYLKGDQRKFYIPCPECGEFITLEWDQVKWDKSARLGPGEWDLDKVRTTSRYICQQCGKPHGDAAKVRALRSGQWRPTSKGAPGYKSYHLNSMYAPWSSCTYGSLAVRYLQMHKGWDMRGWDNGYMALPVSMRGDSADPEELADRRENYGKDLPDGVLVSAAGVDVQDDRLEAELVGFGEGWRSWGLEYVVLHGDTAGRKVWDELDAVLMRWQGSMRLASTMIDSGGHRTEEVYAFCRRTRVRGVHPCKGSNTRQSEIIRNRRGSRLPKVGIVLYMIGTEVAKSWWAASFKVKEDGPRYCAFPEDYDDEYFRQLAAEELRVRYVRGYPLEEWHQVRERNEAIDVRVYALAAMYLLGDRELRRRALRSKPKTGEANHEEKDRAAARPTRRPARAVSWASRF